MTRRFASDDSGAALIHVLVVITVLALGLSVTMSFADTSIRTTVNLRAQAADVYNADGAVQAAINTIRNSAYNGSTGQHCFGGTDALELPNFYGADSAAVSCTTDPARVLIQCPPGGHCNRPGSAILTLGTVGEDGLNIQQNTGSTFRVHGVVFSNSNINVVNGALNTNTRVYARTTCSGTIQSTPSPASCSYGSTANSLGDDPGYTKEAATVPGHRALPACTTANSVVTFEPGYYDDAAGLSAMMSGHSPCRHSTWWFKPGPYYFDFHNSGPHANPLLPSGGNVWTVDDGQLVAGTASGTPPGGPLTPPPVPATIPGSCVNPINDASAVGVQFIFGGDSQFAIKAGEAEICGTYSADRPPVAVYGLMSGSDPTTSLAGANALKPTAVATPNDFGASATVAALADTGGAYATWKSTKNNDKGKLTVNGYVPPSSIPKGSVLTSAVVKVVHRHSDTTSDDLDVSLTPTGGTALNGTIPGHAGGTTFQSDSLPLDTGGTGALAKAVYGGTFTGASIAVTANLKNKNDTEDIDAIRLELSYVAPAFRARSGCIQAPYTGTGSSGCALIKSVNNSGNQFYVQGTTYAPGAVLDITLNNAAEQVFRFGVIARSLWIKETGSFSYTGVVIEVPDDSPGFGVGVYLSAYVCPGSSTCAPGAPAAAVLRAKVAFVDDDPAAATPGQRQVIVLSWSTPT